MTIRWYGLVAPEQAATGDRRMFATNALTYRQFPLPAAWQRVSSSGHAGSVVVASFDKQYNADGGIWGAGEFLDPRIVPEVTEAIYLLEKKLIGPSVDLDPDLAYEVVEHPTLDGEFAMQVTRATVHGVTFVQGPAFPQVHITVDNDEEMAILASAGITIATFAVNGSTWRGMPVAPRETEFDADAAIQRIAEWSGGDAGRFGKAFLYYDTEQPANNRESYRLPVADIHNGKLTLIPRAVFSAATILSGAHGGLPNVPDQQKIKLQQVVTEIYDTLRESYGDPRVIPPWQRGGRAGATSSEGTPTEASMDSETFAVNSSGWSSLPTSEGDWDEGAARRALDAWAGDDTGKYGRAFLWNDGSGNKTGFKFPIAMPVNGKLTIFIRAVNNAKSRLSQANIPAADKARIETILNSIQKRYGNTEASLVDGTEQFQSRLGGELERYWTRGEGAAKIRWGEPGDFKRCVRQLREHFPRDPEGLCANLHHEALGKWPGREHTLTAAGVLYPDKQWFADPKLGKATPLHVTEDGRVFGHLATWKKCHLGVGNRCVIAPKSKTGYKHFHLGTVLCDDGEMLPIGKITLGTGHADKTFGVVPAAEHYDNTGTCVAVVRAGEDRYGVWVAGTLLAGVADTRVAELRRSPLSGDWRRVDGNLELVAALAVNDPGFPVVHEDGDEVYSLTAAGVIVGDDAQSIDVIEPAFGVGLLHDVDAWILRSEQEARGQEVSRMFHDLLPPDEEGCSCNV